MMNHLNLPANCSPLSEEEMIYTEGGATDAKGIVIGVCAVVGGIVLGSSYVWGIGQAREWMSYSKNREGNFFTVLGRAIDDIGEDMSNSPGNFLRDAVSTTMIVVLAPLSAILISL